MANTNGFIKMAVGALVVIIVAAGVILPLFASAEKTAGPATTRENTTIADYRFVPSTEDVTIDLEKDGDTGLWAITINGEEYTTAADQNVTILYSDSIALVKNSAGTVLTVVTADGETTNAYAKKIVFSDGAVTFTVPSDSYTYTAAYSWLYILDSDGTMANHNGNHTTYVNSINDIVAGGYYSTGENDCYYSVKNGEVTVSGEYEASLSYDIALVDGTTDIYAVTNFVITVGDETFTPFRVLAPVEISGHEPTGITYTIVSILPVIILVGVLMMVVTAFISNRRA